jgi:pimeloyl-ACP methyl ester carboxylesterase
MHHVPVTDQRNQQASLPRGRQLGFAEYGDPHGQPIFYFHGWPGSRLEAKVVDDKARKLELRVIAIDRPGYGISSFTNRESIAEWAKDVSDFADGLRLDRFTVLGVSGGAPYAAACAARIPERLDRVLLVCGLGPVDTPGATEGMVALNRWLLIMARRAPWLGRVFGGFCVRRLQSADSFLPPQIERRLPQCDRDALACREFHDALMKNSHEAFRAGSRAAIWDGCLYVKPWGFRLEEIQIPVRLWHGESDIIVPVAMGRQYAKVIPRCQATFFPNEGHFSLPLNCGGEILDAALGRKSSP